MVMNRNSKYLWSLCNFVLYRHRFSRLVTAACTSCVDWLLILHKRSITTSMPTRFLCTAEPVGGSAPCMIDLRNSQETIFGRNDLCKIDDPAIPERQVSMRADYESGKVYVKQLGPQPAYLDGLSIGRGNELSTIEGSEITLVDNGPTYKLKFHFSPNRPQTSSSMPVEDISPAKPPAKRIRQEEFNWSIVDKGSILVCMYGQVEEIISEYNGSLKIASFDIDGTLIKTKSGHVFPTDTNDWQLWHPKVKPSLEQLHKDGYVIVLFSNQSSLRVQAKVPGFKSKVNNILKTLEVPAVVLIAAFEDINRKPAPGMWRHLCHNILKGKDVDMTDSMFVGDAAGRKDNWKPGRKKDFAISDRLFARNIKLKFLTPDEFFLHEKTAAFLEPDFQPGDYSTDVDVNSICKNLSGGHSEVIVMVGLPACGKSTFTKTFLCPKGYVRINRDILGSAVKCERLLKDSLSQKKKVVIDNTNLDVATRRKIVETANQFNVPVRCFIMDGSFRRILHNNQFRNITEKDSVRVTDAVIHNLNKKFQEPTLDEGFTEIVKIPFIPSFRNKSEEELYNCYLVDPK